LYFRTESKVPLKGDLGGKTDAISQKLPLIVVCNRDGQVKGICNSIKEGMPLLGGVSGVEPPYRNCPTPTLPPETATLLQDLQLEGRESESVI
jgi:hypothetical protein